MTLAAGITKMGRKQAELLMESTVTITRKGGATTTDPETGVVSPSITTIYEGKCRLRMPDARPTGVAAAGQSVEKQSPVLSLPIAAEGSVDVRPDDVAVVYSALDGYSVTVRIAGLHTQTHSTARRFPVEVETS